MHADRLTERPAADCAGEFSAYVRARRLAMLRTAYRLTGDAHDAEDLLQTALAKVYLAWPRIADKGAADAYLRRTLSNTLTSRWRLRRVDEYATDVLPERPGPADPFAALDLHQALDVALRQLTPRQRAVLVLRYYEGLTEAETAAALDISAGTVKSTTHRALARLRGDTVLAGSVGGPAAPLPLAS